MRIFSKSHTKLPHLFSSNGFLGPEAFWWESGYFSTILCWISQYEATRRTAHLLKDCQFTIPCNHLMRSNTKCIVRMTMGISSLGKMLMLIIQLLPFSTYSKYVMGRLVRHLKLWSTILKSHTSLKFRFPPPTYLYAQYKFFRGDFQAHQTCLSCQKYGCPVDERQLDSDPLVEDIVLRKPGDIIIGGKVILNKSWANQNLQRQSLSSQLAFTSGNARLSYS